MNDEQKAALDLAVLNLKTHGDDQLLRAVQPLIEYYEANATLSAVPDGGKGEAVATVERKGYQICNTLQWHVPFESLPVGASLYTAPQAECAPRCKTCDGTGDVHSPDGEWRGVCAECAPRALTDKLRALFLPNPPGELGPTDEPDSAYRLGYNSALEDAIDAIEQAVKKG